MRNRLLEIVAFLIDFVQDNQSKSLMSEDVSEALFDLGYSETEVSTAIDWFLEKFQTPSIKSFNSFPQSTKSQRILTSEERELMETEAYGFLLKMHQSQIIDYHQLEVILERLQIFSGKKITLEEMKYVLSSVLFAELESMADISIFESNEDNSKQFN